MNLKKVWLVAIVTSLFFSVLSPVAMAYYRSPVDVDGDGYIRFGDGDANSQFEENGLNLTVVEKSISHSWVDLTMRMWGNMVDQREIDKFILLANGKIVQEFYPQLVDGEEGPVWTNWYAIKADVPALIGAKVYFQVVAVQVHEHSNGVSQYAVAWSDTTDEIMMDDLPVKDKEAISILYAMLEYLKRMLPLLEKMLSKLEEISKQIETMFTPTPAAAAKLENAANKLIEKTPIDDMIKQSNQMKDMFENTPTNAPLSELQFGEKRDWFQIGMSHYLIDLTQWRKEVEMIRKLLDAIIWMEFFLFLIRYLQPKLRI